MSEKRNFFRVKSSQQNIQKKERVETNEFLKFTEPRSQFGVGHIAQSLLAITITTLFGCHSNCN